MSKDKEVSFSLALDAIKKGLTIARSGWNGKGMFVVLSEGVKLLPSSKFFPPKLSEHAVSIGGAMDVRPSMMLKTAQDDVSYWVPSCSDCLAEDWIISK